tara:strand:+ start:1299 stop:2402 length:1104 start_codon:yes stop_codon:yes gene_type:complete
MTKARGLADLGNVYSDGALSNRNLIINGAMQVAQRGTSSTAQGYNTVDRFKATSDGTMVAAVVTQSQDATGPQGFSNSCKVSVGTPETVTNLDYYYVSQCIEAQNLQHLNFGLPSAEGITLSFWVRSSVTGTYTVNLYRQDATRCFPKTYTVNSADVWEKKTIIINGDTVGQIVNDSGRGIEIYWTLSAGSNYTTGTDGVWSAYLGTNFSANHAANVIGTASATWQITGVQLEVGDTATPFEHRSFGQELALCQRYYERSYDYGTASGTATGNGGATFVCNNYSSGQVLYAGQMRFVVAKRAVPTFSFWSHTGVAAKWFEGVAGFAEAIHNPPSITWTGHTGVQFFMATVGANSNTMYGHWAADAEL